MSSAVASGQTFNFHYHRSLLLSIITLQPRDINTQLFIKAATWHGDPDEAERLLTIEPGLATADIFTAAVTGNVAAVQRFIEEDPGNAKITGEPYGGTALVYLCMSKFLRFQKQHNEDFILAASVLLEAGADPNAGFWTIGEFPEFQTALYGAAGIAHNARLTSLLLKYGADPNDGEVTYHAPETNDPEVLRALVETGKLKPQSLSLMLIRKHDWHDTAGIEYLLQHRADPNVPWGKDTYALHHALSRSNSLEAIELLLKHGADAGITRDGQNAVIHAAREGRGDVLALFRDYEISFELTGVDKLISACAEGNSDAVKSIINQSPEYLDELKSLGGELLARFTLNGNAPGVKQLLQIGIDINAPYMQGDAYFGIPKSSQAIHVAAWLGRPYMVELLIEHGAHTDQPDNNGLTPLALAIRACTHSYWTERRSPDSVAALLKAGASLKNISYPTGYAAVDKLLHTVT
ncbi:ankyrin repeat domain-containing protein [Flavitalea antarctica]